MEDSVLLCLSNVLVWDYSKGMYAHATGFGEGDASQEAGRTMTPWDV